MGRYAASRCRRRYLIFGLGAVRFSTEKSLFSQGSVTSWRLFCLTFQVVVLMNVDLLRQQQRWKDGLQELRTGLASVEAQVRRVWKLRSCTLVSPLPSVALN